MNVDSSFISCILMLDVVIDDLSNWYLSKWKDHAEPNKVISPEVACDMRNVGECNNITPNTFDSKDYWECNDHKSEKANAVPLMNIELMS